MNDNSIKIVQSYWSKAYNRMYNFGWAHRLVHYMSWALSCMQLRKFYRNVELVTDEEGYDLLIEKLKLPYSSVKVALDSKLKPETVWTLGKFEAYRLQDRPFIHVDGDIYIWKRFPSRIEKAGLVAQNIERNYPFNVNILNEMCRLSFKFPFNPMKRGDMIEANMGITGGNDIGFIQKYHDCAQNFLKENLNKLSSLSKGEDSITTIMEQYLFYELAQIENKKIEYLIPEFPYSKMCLLTMFHLLPSSVEYIHCLGANKRTDISCDRVARLLLYHYPQTYNHILKLSKEHII